MERIVRLHSSLATTLIVVLAALALWGLAETLLGRVSRAYLAGLAVAQLLIVAEVLLGVATTFGVERPGRLILHVIYGAVALLLLPGARLALRDRAGRWDAATYGAICLFLVAVSVRAAITGG